MIKIIWLRIFIFTLLILFVFGDNVFAKWAEPPYFNIYNKLPEFSYNWTTLYQLEQFRLDIERYRIEELEEYNKKIEIFNKNIQRELKAIEDERKNGRINIEEYNKEIKEYKYIMNVVYNKCIDIYKEGLSVYCDLIYRYKFAVKQKNKFIKPTPPQVELTPPYISPPAAFPFRNKIELTTELTERDIKDIILQYINNYYTKRNGFIQLTASEDNYIHLYINKIRHEVIKEKKLWEKIQIEINFYKSGYTLIMGGFIDGWFAPGFNPPTEDKGYYDIELEYPVQLRNYRDEWLLGLEQHIQEKENQKKKFEICISDFNHVPDEYFDLYINNLLIGDVHNEVGGETCYNFELKSGINKILLQHKDGGAIDTRIKAIIIPGHWEKIFMGTKKDYIWEVIN